jgi:hypothetical protein
MQVAGLQSGRVIAVGADWAAVLRPREDLSQKTDVLTHRQLTADG